MTSTPSGATIIMHRFALVAAFAVAAAASPQAGSAQSPIDRTVATAATGSVDITNISGSVRVIAWARSEVRVTGTLGEGTERLDVTSAGDRVSIRVVIPERARNVRGSELEVRVPSRKNLTVRTVSADVEISGIEGAVDGEATSGSVEVSGSPRQVRAISTSGDVDLEVTTGRVVANSTSGDVTVRGRASASISVETVSGELQVDAPTPEMTAKSVSGDLTISGATNRVAASSVSGEIEARGGPLQYGSFESVSGSLSFAGALQSDAALNFQSHSGSVHLALPGNLGARFQVTTFSGDIDNEFGGSLERVTRDGPGQDLRFSTGSGGAVVTVRTFSGSVTLERGR